MEVSVYPEAYINNSTNIDISQSNKAILCRKVLDKYKDILCDNKDGCIFKISYVHPIMQVYFECYVSCIEFTAPDNTLFISNYNFNKICLNLEYNKVQIELLNPPQASKIVFTIDDNVIKNIDDIKSNLESLLETKYKFLEKDQEIPFIHSIIKVKEIEPYNICLINNTDLNVEFDIINIPEKSDFIENDPKESIVNEINEIEPDNSSKLSIKELRAKRLAYYNKIKK